MKKMVTLFAVAVLFSTPILSQAASSHAVRGHVTKNGTYVQPHRASNSDSTKSNNWSQKSNVNPYTGKAGTKE